MSLQKENKNPIDHFWDMATGGLMSSSSELELQPNKKAGKPKKSTKSVKRTNPKLSQDNKRSHRSIA